MIHAVDIESTNTFRTGVFLLHGHGRGFNKFAIFPVTAGSCDFADVDFGIEVGGKGIAVITGIDVDDVDVVDFVEVVLLDMGAEDDAAADLDMDAAADLDMDAAADLDDAPAMRQYDEEFDLDAVVAEVTKRVKERLLDTKE